MTVKTQLQQKLSDKTQWRELSDKTQKRDQNLSDKTQWRLKMASLWPVPVSVWAWKPLQVEKLNNS